VALPPDKDKVTIEVVLDDDLNIIRSLTAVVGAVVVNALSHPLDLIIFVSEPVTCCNARGSFFFCAQSWEESRMWTRRTKDHLIALPRIHDAL
jgi:hypothetical protein